MQTALDVLIPRTSNTGIERDVAGGDFTHSNNKRITEWSTDSTLPTFLTSWLEDRGAGEQPWSSHLPGQPKGKITFQGTALAAITLTDGTTNFGPYPVNGAGEFQVTDDLVDGTYTIVEQAENSEGDLAPVAGALLIAGLYENLYEALYE